MVSITATVAPTARTEATLPPPNPDSTTSQITTLSFIDAQHGWLVQNNCLPDGNCTAVVRATTDGGLTWPGSWPMPDTNPGVLRFFTTEDGWLYGLYGWIGTHDGGKTWKPESGGSVISMGQMGEALWAVQQQCPTVGALDCPLHLITSTDMGHTWVTALTQPSLRGTAQFNAIGVHDAWIMADLDPGQNDTGELIATHDRGHSWQTRTYPCQSPDIFPYLAVTTGQLWMSCAGYPGTGQSEQGKSVYRSTDDGQSWERVAYHDFGATEQRGTGSDPKPGYLPGPGLWGLALQAPNKPWLVMAAGALVRSPDGGHTWHYLNLPYERISPSGWGLGPIIFVDERTGWVAGRNGVLRTLDGGEHWDAISIH
jgi:photosystem II stability/assembly factor-like uncharacterized protein